MKRDKKHAYVKGVKYFKLPEYNFYHVRTGDFLFFGTLGEFCEEFKVKKYNLCMGMGRYLQDRTNPYTPYIYFKVVDGKEDRSVLKRNKIFYCFYYDNHLRFIGTEDEFKRDFPEVELGKSKEWSFFPYDYRVWEQENQKPKKTERGE